MKQIAVLGLGKVGHLVATMLQDLDFEVTGVDKYLPAEVNYTPQCGDFTDIDFMTGLLEKMDAVVCCTPFHINKNLAQLATETKTHYFDLTEDVKTTDFIQELAKTSQSLLAPQCGLAPGIISIVANDLAKGFDKIESMKLRVGALPQHPIGKLGYAFNWSPEGLINECIEDCEAIENGQRVMIPALQFKEDIVVNLKQLEAISTSGGLGTLCQTFEGKLNTLNYKSIRYRGHAENMNFLLNELNLKSKREVLKEMLYQANPPSPQDVVHIYAEVKGWRNDQIQASQYVKSFYPKEISGQKRTSIAWTTAASLCAVVELVRAGILPKQGFLKQEAINFKDFLATESGRLFD